MTRYIFIISLLVLSLLAANVSAQEKAPLTSETLNEAFAGNTGSQLKYLQLQAKNLRDRLEQETDKRGIRQDEASLETLEEINEEQDSICYELRSQLADIELQISEIRLQNGMDLLLKQDIPSAIEKIKKQ